jgi:hypothetical protein
VGPRGTDFELSAFLAAPLLDDDRVNAMRRAVAVGFSRHGVVFSAREPAPMAASMPLTIRMNEGQRAVIAIPLVQKIRQVTC